MMKNMQYGFVITTAGRALLAKLAAGGNLQITKTMVGKGKLADDQIAVGQANLAGQHFHGVILIHSLCSPF